MATFFEKMKEWFTGSKASDTASYFTVSNAEEKAFKDMLKASRSFLKVSLKTKEGNIDRIIDDELLHKGLDGGTGIQISGVFREKDGSKATMKYLEEFDEVTRGEIFKAAREAFFGRCRNHIVEGGIRLFEEPHFNWDKLNVKFNHDSDYCSRLHDVMLKVDDLLYIKACKENAYHLKIHNDHSNDEFILSGKVHFCPTRQVCSKTAEFCHYFRSSDLDADKLAILNSKDKESAKELISFLIDDHFSKKEEYCMQIINDYVQEGKDHISELERQVNAFNRSHDFAYMTNHDVSFMYIENDTPTWKGSLDMTKPEHLPITKLPDNLHVIGHMTLSKMDYRYADIQEHAEWHEKQSSIIRYPSGLHVDGKIFGSSDYLEELKNKSLDDCLYKQENGKDYKQKSIDKTLNSKAEMEIMALMYKMKSDKIELPRPFAIRSDIDKCFHEATYVQSHGIGSIKAAYLGNDKQDYLLPIENFDDREVVELVNMVYEVNNQREEEKTYDSLEYDGLKWKLRSLILPSTGEHVLIGTVNLEQALRPDVGHAEWKDRKAQAVDERIFYYVKGDEINLSSKELIALVEREALGIDNPVLSGGELIKEGMKVIWNDPDVSARDLSRVWTVDNINGEVITISDGFSEAEVTANELSSLRNMVISDLKERAVQFSSRSFPDDAVERISAYGKDLFDGEKGSDKGEAEIASIKSIVQADPDVVSKPKQWFTDASKEFEAIVKGEEVNLSNNHGLRI